MRKPTSQELRVDLSLIIYLNPSSLLFFYQSIQVVLMMDTSCDSKRWQKIVLTVDSPVTNSEITNHRGLKSKLHFISFKWVCSKGFYKMHSFDYQTF